MSIEENAKVLARNVELRLDREIVGPGKISRVIDEEIEKLRIPEDEKSSTRALANDIRVRNLRKTLRKSA